MARLEKVWVGINFTLLGTFVCFLALKLTGVIGWSWWLVWSPVLGFLGVFVVMVVVLSLFFPESLESKVEHKVDAAPLKPLPEGKAFRAAAIFAGVVSFIVITIPTWTKITYPRWVLPAGYAVMAVTLIPTFVYELVRINRHYKQ
jgi:hypothetical protein